VADDAQGASPHADNLKLPHRVENHLVDVVISADRFQDFLRLDDDFVPAIRTQP
jgi:hypothetical protein